MESSSLFLTNDVQKLLQTYLGNGLYTVECAMLHLARCGQLQGLIFLAETTKQSYPRDIANHAAAYGHLDTVIYLHDHGITCDYWGADLAAERNHIDVVTFLYAEGIFCSSDGPNRVAACTGNCALIRFLHARGSKCTPEGATKAAKQGFIDTVQVLHSLGIDCTDLAADAAAQNGHLEMVRQLREYGINTTIVGMKGAVRNGHLSIIEDLYDNGVDPDANCADLAAAAGYPLIVAFFRTKGIYGYSDRLAREAEENQTRAICALQSYAQCNHK